MKGGFDSPLSLSFTFKPRGKVTTFQTGMTGGSDVEREFAYTFDGRYIRLSNPSEPAQQAWILRSDGTMADQYGQVLVKDSTSPLDGRFDSGTRHKMRFTFRPHRKVTEGEDTFDLNYAFDGKIIMIFSRRNYGSYTRWTLRDDGAIVGNGDTLVKVRQAK